MDIELKMVRGEIENLQGVFGIYTAQELNSEIVHPLIIGGDIYAIKDLASKKETNAANILSLLTEKIETSRNIYFLSKTKVAREEDLIEFMPGDILTIKRVLLDGEDSFNYELNYEQEKALEKIFKRASEIYFSYYQSQKKFEKYTVDNFTDILKKEIDFGRKSYREGNLEKLSDAKKNVAEHLTYFGFEKDLTNILKMIEFNSEDSEWLWSIYGLIFDSSLLGDKKSELIYRQAIDEETAKKMKNWDDFPFKI